MSAFFTTSTWATAVRAGKDDFTVPPPPPFLDRAATAVPRATPAPAFDHRSTEFRGRDNELSAKPDAAVVPVADKIRNLNVHFTDEFIAGLKARAGVVRCSTFQCLLAHVWKKITAARDLNLKPEEYTQVRVAVNCRGRADPPVPMDFFGNMVLWAFPRLQVRDLRRRRVRPVLRRLRGRGGREQGGARGGGGGGRHDAVPGRGGGQLAGVPVPPDGPGNQAATRVPAAGPTHRGAHDLRAVQRRQGRRRPVRGHGGVPRRGVRADCHSVD
ncbi:unnamed protein product [Urochloa humidicola]